MRAAQMPLWFDEILTILIAKLPRTSDIWAACADNADGMPPMFYLAVRAMTGMGWNDSLAVRLLSVAGYAVFTFCLFRFVSRQKPAVYGIVAMLLPSLTGCWFFATAGRPYGILLGCTGVAMVCWQSISRGNRRGRRNRAFHRGPDDCGGRSLSGFSTGIPVRRRRGFPGVREAKGRLAGCGGELVRRLSSWRSTHP